MTMYTPIVSVEWIREYQKMLEAECPPEMDEHTRNFMILIAPALAIRNRYEPLVEEQQSEIQKLRARVKELEDKLAKANLNSVSDFLAWVGEEEARGLRLFGTEQARKRNAIVLEAQEGQ